MFNRRACFISELASLFAYIPLGEIRHMRFSHLQLLRFLHYRQAPSQNTELVKNKFVEEWNLLGYYAVWLL
jgi:hypothetical protein